MKFLQVLPLLLTAIVCLSGCERDERVVYYEKPRQVFHGKSYPPLEMVVVERRPIHHYTRPRIYTYIDPTRAYDYRRTPYAYYNQDNYGYGGETSGGPRQSGRETQRGPEE